MGGVDGKSEIRNSKFEISRGRMPRESCLCYPSPVAEADNPISVEGVHFSRQRLTVEEGVRLELYQWRPEQETVAEPILFVAGWISLVRGWKPLLERLVTTHPVYYLETREKRSAEIDPKLMRPERFSGVVSSLTISSG